MVRWQILGVEWAGKWLLDADLFLVLGILRLGLFGIKE